MSLDTNVLRSFDFGSDRPSLKHLNADSSWLLSLPYPSHSRAPAGRCRYNIAIDVWLTGPQVDLFGQFSSQEHATPSAFQTLAQVNHGLHEAELKATRHRGPAPDYFIDAVCCSHEFTDHCHEASLRELPSSVPVFAPKKAAALVKSWEHFDTVVEIPVVEPGFDWTCLVTPGLPPWVRMGRLQSRGEAPIYFHSALAIFFSSGAQSGAEAVVYTPHGIMADSMQAMTTAEPRVRTLALLHGLHNVSLAGAQLNMGMNNALQVLDLLEAKYWLPTHDEVKLARGLVAWFLKRVQYTFAAAPGSHAITTSEDRPDFPVKERPFHELVNGESLTLE